MNSGIVLVAAIGVSMLSSIKKTKKFNLTPIFPCKSSWDFSNKNKCDNILNNWRVLFQASDNKEQHFLELLNNDLNPVELSIAKGRPWLKFFGYSNLLCTRASRAIVNHAPIGEYWLRFFFRKEFKYLCGLYPIKSRHHIFHKCTRYWNPRRDSITHLTLFLEFNSNAFSFGNSIMWMYCI